MKKKFKKNIYTHNKWCQWWWHVTKLREEEIKSMCNRLLGIKFPFQASKDILLMAAIDRESTL